MTTLMSKVLAVFVTIASVAFMAVVMANVSAGGPNWPAKAKELDELAFERANPQAPWTVKRRTDGADMGGGPILPAAIVAAQKKLIDGERTQHTDLDQKISILKSKITEAKALIEVDLAAMQRRQADLEKQFVELMAQMSKVSQDFTAEAKKQTEDLATLKLRSQEYIQVKNQLEELKAQREATTEELARLKALVYQANANLERATKRRQLLVDEGVAIEGGYDKAEPEQVTDPAAAKPAAAPEKPAEEENKSEDKPEKPEESN